MRADRVFFALALILALTGAARDRFDGWIDATALPPLSPETATELRDRDGLLLRAYTVVDGRWRLATDIAAVDPGYIAMLLAYEDKRFHGHDGIDPRAILRAGINSLRAGHLTSGASTLTMQVARLLEGGTTGRIKGKLRQMRVALALERRLGKSAILQLYLHLAPYGGNVEGIRAASLTWFGKEPARLTPAQAALLVALPQSPETRRPDRHAGAARTARDRVLARAEAAGVIDADTAAAARGAPVPTLRRPFPALAPHLSDRLRQVSRAPVLTTTLDRASQTAMETLARQSLRGHDPRLSIALIVADHTTGAIRAHVGSAHYDNDPRLGFVDMTRALRSPGSTLKPLIYGLAFDAGLGHPDTLIDDAPMTFGAWAPQNFDGQFRGEVTLRTALQASLNLPVVQLTRALGPARLLAEMRRTGMRPELPGGRPGLALSLGGVGVTLEELVTLYAALANGGTATPLDARPNIPDATAPPARQASADLTASHPQAAPGTLSPVPERAVTARILSPAAAWHLGDILSTRPGTVDGKIAYKTGTSYGHRDAWALGWDGRHVVGVWMGRPDGTPVPGAFGADLAVPVLMQAFARLGPRTPLPAPPAAARRTGRGELPANLRRFAGPVAAFAPDPDAPQIAFPPDGARLALDGGPLVMKLRKGRPPFAVLADGRPVAQRITGRETWLDIPGPGFVTLSVIDAAGRSARSEIRLD